MKQLLDFLPLILFFILYKFYMDLPIPFIEAMNGLVPLLQLTPGEAGDAIYLATLAAIVATVIQVGLVAVITRQLEKMPLVTLALLLLFGGATLLFKDPLFVQWKPTAINWLFGLFFLGSQFIGDKPVVERMMSMAIDLQHPRMWRQLNLAWVCFFFLSGLANVLVAPQIDPLGFEFSEETWVEFKLFGLLGLTVVFVIIQAIFIARHLPDQHDNEEEIN